MMNSGVTKIYGISAGVIFDLFGFFISITLCLLTLTDTFSLNSSFAMIFAVALLAISRPIDRNQAGNPLIFLILAYLAFLVVGHFVDESIRPKPPLEARKLTAISFFSMMTGVFLAGLVGTMALRSAKNRQQYFRSSYAKLMMFFGFASYLLLVARAGSIPLLASNPDVARYQFFSGAGYLAIFFHGLPILIMAYLSASFLPNARASKRSAHLMISVVLIMQLLVGMRGVFLATLLAYTLIYYRLSGITLKRSMIILYVLCALLFLGAVGSFRRFGGLSLDGMIFELIVVFTARTEVLGWIVDRFPVSETYGWSRYVTDIVRLIPGVNQAQNVELRYLLIGEGGPMHEAAELNAGIVGEAWINAGNSGVVVVSFLFGLLIMLSYFRSVKDPDSFLKNATFSIIFSYMIVSITSGVGTRVPQLVILGAWILIASRLFKKR